MIPESSEFADFLANGLKDQGILSVLLLRDVQSKSFID